MSIKKFALTLAAVMYSALMTTSVEANEDLFVNEERQRQFIQEKILEYFPEDPATMLAIAYCETRSRPFIHWEADGSLRPHDEGESTAAGTFQVLLYLHGPDIQARDLDMYDIDDYMSFVRYLYDRGSSRTSDWDESRSCWQSRISRYERQVASLR